MVAGRVNTPGGGEADLRRLLAAVMADAEAGRLDQAIAALESAGPARAHPLAQNLLGSLQLRAGRPRDALRCLDAAIRMAPDFAEAQCNRGAALCQLGRLDPALTALDRAIKLRQAYPLAHFNRGAVLLAMERPAEAIAAYDCALLLQPDFTEAAVARGYAHLAAGNPLAALGDFDGVLKARRDEAEALAGRLEALLALDRFAEALAAADAVLVNRPGDRKALIAKGQALTGLKRFDEALAAYQRLVAAEPEVPEHRMRVANVLVEMQRLDEALGVLDAAARMAPERWDIVLKRASVLADQGRTEAVFAELDRARKLGAPRGEDAAIRGLALADSGAVAEALPHYETAIRRRPDDAALRRAHGFLLLHSGDFARGWPEFEQRLAMPDFAWKPFDRLAPRWTGEALRDETLLVYAEQGLGDTIQFVRYLPMVRERCAEVTLVAPAPLHDLIRPLVGDVTLVAKLAPEARFDRQVSLMSLGSVFGTSEATIPGAVPYLFAEPERVAAWRARIGADGFKVGIAWQGNPDYRGDRFRSLPLSLLAPLAAVPGVRLIGLQAIHGLDQLDALPAGMAVERLGDAIERPASFDDIAAVMANLDLVVSVDSATAHLAGALGRPTFLAIRLQPEWRWLQGRADSPWYPTMRVFRQARIGDWAGVVAAMAAEVGRLRGQH